MLSKRERTSSTQPCDKETDSQIANRHFAQFDRETQRQLAKRHEEMIGSIHTMVRTFVRFESSLVLATSLNRIDFEA